MTLLYRIYSGLDIEQYKQSSKSNDLVSGQNYMLQGFGVMFASAYVISLW